MRIILVNYYLSSVSKPTIYPVPVRAHVRQFLLKEFGNDPWAIHQNTYLGRSVLMVVEKLPYRQLHRPEVLEGTAVRLTLPTALKHYTLTPESARELGAMFDKLFQQQLIMFVKGQVAVTQNELAALRCFYRLYDINPDDFDLEVGRKVYRDYKDKILRENGHFEAIYGDGDARRELFSDYAVRS